MLLYHSEEWLIWNWAVLYVCRQKLVRDESLELVCPTDWIAHSQYGTVKYLFTVIVVALRPWTRNFFQSETKDFWEHGEPLGSCLV